MNFLELTSYIGEPQGYADIPEFQSDVWPLLRRNADEIESVFLFRNSSRSFEWAGHYEFVTNTIARIGSLPEFTDSELEKLHYWSFYAGHLNVLYRVSTESSVVRELCNLYPVVNLSSEELDQLALEPEYLAELRAFTAASPPHSVHFAFAHDGDPLYIFAPLEVLRALLRTRRS